jgi:hypothetical protein
MSHTRNFNPEWLIVVAAIVFTAAGVATVFDLLYRPVVAVHRPVPADSIAASTSTAPDVSPSVTPDTSFAAQHPTEPQEVKSSAEASHVPRWGVWLAADVSESGAWALYRERVKPIASLIDDREPIVLFRQFPGMGKSKRYIIAIVDDDRAPLERFCRKLTAAGGTCSVKRNEIGPE